MKMIAIRGAIVAALLAAASVPALAEPTELWSLDGLMNPESVYHDAGNNALYVSNVNGPPTDKDGNGFISKVATDGKMLTLKWIEGLSAPKGMVMKGDTLYVTDIDRLIEIKVDASGGKIVAEYPAEGAVFLNDPAVSDTGTVFVSDIATRKIWALNDGKMAVWYEGDDLMHPNGLRVENGKLLVAGWGRDMGDDGSTKTPGNLFTIDLETKELKNLGGGQGIGNLDGLESDENGAYLVTDFMAGALYRINQDGTHETLLDLNAGSADLEVVDNGATAIIPIMMDNRMVAYKMK